MNARSGFSFSKIIAEPSPIGNKTTAVFGTRYLRFIHTEVSPEDGSKLLLDIRDLRDEVRRVASAHSGTFLGTVC